MSNTAFVVGGILPYIAVPVFVAGVAYRALSWQRLPQPGSMTLYPRSGNGPMPLIKEAMFFPGLHKGDRLLWGLAWLFHVSLALAFLGHLRVVTGAIDAVLAVALTPGQVHAFSAVAGGVAGATLLATAIAFVVRRTFIRRVREISTAPDFLSLALVVAVIVSGSWMRFVAGADLAQTRAWVASLLSFSPMIPAEPAFLVHLFCAEVLVLHLAFSKLLHFCGFFFTFNLIKRSQP